MELYALCQILPGPTSTQTITALGFKIGGPNLAYLTLLVWMLPAVTVMIAAGIFINILNDNGVSLDFLRFVQPIAVGIVAYSAYQISRKVVSTRTGYFLMILGCFSAYFYRSPWLFPIIILIGGFATSFKFKSHPVAEKTPLKISWSNFWLWGGVLVFAAILGGITDLLAIRIFENFYRNGSLIFGGGQVLVPMMYTEFVEFKAWLGKDEFISGYALSQALPGPTFSFSAFIGTLSLKEYGIPGEIIGGFMAACGIFLPGTFLIFFVIRFWTQLKEYRVVRASLEGIQAVSAGLVIAATFILFEPIEATVINYLLMMVTLGLLFFTKVPTPLIILAGLITGIIFN